ncbi:hypothetical protein OSG00_000662 [Shigella sonnei]|nr:hypothetical protein [Shigella sonnei]
MANKNDFKPFATGAGANVTSQAEWEALAALTSGFQAGKASSAQVNKALRQGTFVASALAQFISNKLAADVIDDGDLSGFVTDFINAISAQSLTRANPFADIKADGTVSTALSNLDLTGGLGANIVGRLIGVKVITTSQTYTPSTGTKAIVAEVIGGGGGGQGAGSVRVVGGGGGSGAYVKALITSLASSYAITIGSGGIGSASTAAGQQSNPGGTTTFGSIITCTGGLGGISDQTVAATTGSYCLAGGGQGGTATTVATTGVDFIITQNGSRGSFGAALHPNYLGGNGGVSPLGSGGRGGATAPADATFNASGYGGGGGGNTSLSTAASGGNGSPGVVIVWEYA